MHPLQHSLVELRENISFESGVALVIIIINAITVYFQEIYFIGWKYIRIVAYDVFITLNKIVSVISYQI